MNRRNLTSREATVAELVSQGLSNQQIADQLGVSLATVKRHLNNIMIKWNCINRTQVAVQAILRVEETHTARLSKAEESEPSAPPRYRAG